NSLGCDRRWCFPRCCCSDWRRNGCIVFQEFWTFYVQYDVSKNDVNCNTETERINSCRVNLIWPVLQKCWLRQLLWHNFINEEKLVLVWIWNFLKYLLIDLPISKVF